ncbi:MAG: GNAT family N-acetyltransferase [Bacteroidota bacterium]
MNLLHISPSISLKTNFKSDQVLVSKILDLTRLSYVTNEELIQREIEHNSDIYITTNENDDLLAFFMVNLEQVSGEDTYYLGLSACRDELKGQGLGKALYLKFMADCRRREVDENKKFLLWWTTATPIVYYWFNKYVSNVQPDMDGNYNEKGETIARRICEEKFSEIEIDPVHPFILRSVAQNTSYSLNEQARLLVATENLKMDVFQKFNLREENADRFLMIGYAPE